MLQDFIYLGTLAVSIKIGGYYKDIASIDVKKHYGTGIGILMTFLVCGHYLYHTILMVWLNTVILKCCDKRFMHLVSLAYTWTHLFFLHCNLSHAEHVIIIHQNIALRLVGIAFEVYKARRERSTSAQSVEITESNDETMLEVTAADVFSYAFCFIGLHKGPYYRYKMYVEHLKGTFGSLGNFRQITEHKLKKVLVCVIAYSLLRIKYSTQIYHDKAFYEYEAETRYLYNVPFLAMYVLRNIIVMMLCTCVCTEAGFGVFPARTMPLPGHGPSTKHSMLSMSRGEALEQEFNFSMIKCYQKEKLIIGPKMIDTVRSWEMPTRYWFWRYIHQTMRKASKEMRSAMSFLAWTIWNGASLRSIIISCTLWVYIHIESEYSRLYNTMGQMKIAWDIGFSIMRLFCLIYLTPCFVLNDAPTILKYYNSMFWVFHGFLLVLIIGVMVIHMSRTESISFT